MSESNNNYYQIPGSVNPHNSSSMQPILNESSSSLATENNMEYPVLLLTQQPDSHHFNERRIVLNDTIKVGRSVARARPSDMNAIFDCKVLSRNHAIFWYDSGKVWLRDTKSSNGTFVNSQLLSKGTEDSPPREIYSGDIIQFGVEVVENTTTHGCIIAQVSIFMSDGSEIRRHTDMVGLTSGSIPISNYYEEQIYQLAQYIQEAAHREQTLEKKLNSLSQLIIDTQEASDSSWKVILNQDRLMEKLEMLQEQVEIHSKGDEQDSLAADLRRVLDQRYGLERESKNLLENLIQEKADVLQHVVDLEHSLETSEEECSQLRSAFETLQQEHGKISSKVAAGKDEVDSLQKRLQEAQAQYSNEMNLLSADKDALLNRYSQLCEEADHLRIRLKEMEIELAEEQSNSQREPDDTKQIREDLDWTESEIYKCRDMIQQSSDKQLDLSSSVKGLQSQLSKALMSEILDLQNLHRLEESIADSETNLNSFVISATSDLAYYFIESHRQIRNGMEMITLLKDEVNRLQNSLTADASIESSLLEMGALLGKMSECQNQTQLILNQIPEKLLLKVKEQTSLESLDKDCQTLSSEIEHGSTSDVTDFDQLTVDKESTNDQPASIAKSHILTQTESSDLVHSSVQSCIEHDTQNAFAQTISSYPLENPDIIPNLQTELNQCLGRLESEKKTTDSLKMELVQLQNDKQDLQDCSMIKTKEFEEIKKQLSDAKVDLETRRDATQRVSASEYGQLYQESQQLRKQVQEIEEEMIVKRKEYDALFEQYEALLTGNKISPKPVSDKIEELEELCSKQRTEIEEMRETMNEQYQAILNRSRRISAFSAVPIFVLVLAITILILSFLARPWISIDSRQ